MSAYSGDLERLLSRQVRRGGNAATSTDYTVPQGAPVGEFAATKSPFGPFRPMRPGSIGVRPDYSPQRPDLMILRNPLGPATGAVQRARQPKQPKQPGAGKPQPPSVLNNNPAATWAQTAGPPAPAPAGSPPGTPPTPTPIPPPPRAKVGAPPTFNINTRQQTPGPVLPGINNMRAPAAGVPITRLKGRRTVNAKNLPKTPPTSSPAVAPGATPSAPSAYGTATTPQPLAPNGTVMPEVYDINTRKQALPQVPGTYPRPFPGLGAQQPPAQPAPASPGVAEWSGFPEEMPNLDEFRRGRMPKGVPYGRMSDKKVINAKNLPKPPPPAKSVSAWERIAQEVDALGSRRPENGIPYGRVSDQKNINFKPPKASAAVKAPPAQKSESPTGAWWLSSKEDEQMTPSIDFKARSPKGKSPKKS
jgi:hypothetical protein